MPLIARAAAVLLLVAVATWPADASLMLFMPPAVAPPAHPAPCHGDEPASPPTAPEDFQCCAGGHHEAIPTVAFSPRPLVALLAEGNGGHDLSSGYNRPQFSSISEILSNSPPGITQLRI